MMKTKFFYSFLALIAGMVLFSSCKKSNDAGKYIVKDAAFVMVANGESISKKLPWEELRNGEMFKELSSDSSMNEFTKQAMENPDVTGIDIKSNITTFVVKDSTGGYATVEGNIKDAAKFKSYFTGSIKGATSNEKDGYSFLVKEKMTLGWNKDRFIIVYDLPQLNDMNGMPSLNGLDDSIYNSPAAPVLRNGTELIKSLFNLKEENSLAKNEKFGDLMNEKGDFHFYFNAENFSPGSMGMAALAMLNIGKLTEGAVATGVANFEDGKIVVDIKSYSGKELSEIWKKYNGKSINTDMIKRSPVQKVAVAIGFNFQPQGVQEFLRLTGLEGFANLGAKQFGFSVDDFVKANKGDLAITVGDFTDSSGAGSSDPQAVFSVSVNDKVAFAKLIAAASKARGGTGLDKMGYSVNDNYFALATTKSLADAYMTGTSNNNYDFISDISGEPIGAYINLQYLISVMSKNETDTLSQRQSALSLAMWDHAIFKGGDYVDGALKQHGEIILINKKMNSLRQLNSYANKMSAIQKLKDASWKTKMENDTTTVVTPVIPDTTIKM